MTNTAMRGKRLLGVAIMLFWAGMTLYGAVAANPDASAAADSMRVSAFVLAGGLFGLDAVKK